MTESETDDFGDFEQQLARKQRIKMIAGIVVGVAVIAVVLIGYLLWPKQPDPRCEDKQVQPFLKLREIPAAAVHRVCSLPSPLDKTLKDCLASPPSMQKLLIFKMVAEHPKLITPMCKDMRSALSQALRQSPGEQSTTFLKRCRFTGMGLGSPSDMAQAPLHRILLAVAVYGALKRSDSKWASKLGRRMLAPDASPFTGRGLRGR